MASNGKKGAHVHWIQDWHFEIIASIVSLLSLGAIAGLLYKYDDAPVFKWYKVTLNTLVSLLSTTSRAALMFAVAESISQWKWLLFSKKERPLTDFEFVDRASRGPSGSLKLLWNVRSPSLWLGAVITIMALAIDPFAQQLVHLATRMEYNTDPQTTIGRAQRYSGGNKLVVSASRWDFTSNNGVNYDGNYTALATADFDMQSSFLFGLGQSLDAAIQRTPFQCDSGNCNWEPFDSLAVCTRCNDISNIVQRNEDPRPERLVDMLDVTNPPGYIATSFQYTLPNGLYISNMVSSKYETKQSQLINNEVVLMTTYASGNQSATNTLKDLDTLLLAMTILRVQPPSDISAEWPNLPVEALECGLYYCVNNYHFKVIDGVLQETVSPVDSATRSPQSWQPDKPVPDSFQKSLEYDWRFSSYERTDLMLGDNFNLTQTAVDGVSRSIRNLMTKTDPARLDFAPVEETALGNGTSEKQHPDEDKYITGWFLTTSSEQYTPNSMSGLYFSKDIEKTFQAIARSMTNVLFASNDGKITVIGKKGLPVTHYQIQWIWIIVPGAFIFGGCIFVLITSLRTAGTGIRAWKSSLLVLLENATHVSEIVSKTSYKKDEEEANQVSLKFPDKDAKSTSIDLTEKK